MLYYLQVYWIPLSRSRMCPDQNVDTSLPRVTHGSKYILHMKFCVPQN